MTKSSSRGICRHHGKQGEGVSGWVEDAAGVHIHLFYTYFKESFQSYYYSVISILKSIFYRTGLHCQEHHGAALLRLLVPQLKDDQLWSWGCRGSHSHSTSNPTIHYPAKVIVVSCVFKSTAR